MRSVTGSGAAVMALLLAATVAVSQGTIAGATRSALTLPSFGSIAFSSDLSVPSLSIYSQSAQRKLCAGIATEPDRTLSNDDPSLF